MRTHVFASGRSCRELWSPVISIMNYAFINSGAATAAEDDQRRGWQPAASPPEIYDLVELQFSDGKRSRGTWNGKFWWGYDRPLRRSGVVQPLAWRWLS